MTDDQVPTPEEVEAKLVEVKKQEADVAVIPEIDLSDDGSLKPKNMMQLKSMCNLYKQSTALNPDLKNATTLLMALQLAVSMKVNPVIILNGLYVIKNRFRFHSALPSNIVMKSGKLQSIRTFCIDEEYKEICLKEKNLLKTPIAGVCITVRNDNKFENETFFTIDDAKAAGLLSKDNYKNYLKQMLMARARSANLEYYFADVLGGLSDMDNAPIDGGRDVIDQRDPNEMLKVKEVGPSTEPHDEIPNFT